MQVGIAQLEQVCDPHGMWPTIILRAVAQRVSLLRRPAGISLMLARPVARPRGAPDRAWPLGCTDRRCPFVSLVALITRRVLLFCAKHLFVAAIGGSSTAGADLDIRLPRRPAGARRQAPSDFGRGALLPWADLQAKNLPAFPYY